MNVPSSPRPAGLRPADADLFLATCENIRPYVPTEPNLIGAIALNIIETTRIEQDRRAGREWHAQQRIATDVLADERLLASRGMGHTDAARKLFAFVNAEKLPYDETRHLHPTKGASWTIGSEDQYGSWERGRGLATEIKSLRRDPLLLERLTFIENYESWQTIKSKYELWETNSMAEDSDNNPRIVKISRDVSYADIVDRNTGEVYELRRHSLFYLEPDLLSHEPRQFLEDTLAAMSDGDVKKDYVLRQMAKEVAYERVETDIVAFRRRIARHVFATFPVSSQFIALRRDTQK